MLLDGVQCLGMNPELKGCGKTNRPQHPQAIFSKTLFRTANGPQNSGNQILPTPDMINALPSWIIKQPIDREVPADGIIPCIPKVDRVGRRPSL